jgi:hypothetical protein
MKRLSEGTELPHGRLKKSRALESKEKLRFEDYHLELEESARNAEKEKKERKCTQDVIDFGTYKKIDPALSKLQLFNYTELEEDLKEEFLLDVIDPSRPDARNPPKMTLRDVVRRVFSDKSLDTLIEYNVKHSDDGVFPAVIYSADKCMLSFLLMLSLPCMLTL